MTQGLITKKQDFLCAQVILFDDRFVKNDHLF